MSAGEADGETSLRVSGRVIGLPESSLVAELSMFHQPAGE